MCPGSGHITGHASRHSPVIIPLHALSAVSGVASPYRKVAGNTFPFNGQSGCAVRHEALRNPQTGPWQEASFVHARIGFMQGPDGDAILLGDAMQGVTRFDSVDTPRRGGLPRPGWPR